MWSKPKESGLFGLDASVGHFDVLDLYDFWFDMVIQYFVIIHALIIYYFLCNVLTIISNANIYMIYSFKLIKS